MEKERCSDNYENDEQRSMESDSVVDVTEDDSNEQFVEQDQSEECEDKNNTSNTCDTGKYLYVLVFSMAVFCTLML